MRKILNNNHNTNNKIFLNRYSPQYPASPDYFANRSETIEYFSKTVLNCARLKPPAPIDFIVLGDWGIGKTSLLYKMEQIALRGKPEITSRDFEKHWPSIASSIEKTLFIGHLNRALDKERELLKKIASLDETSVSPSMIKGIKGTPMLFSRLEEKGLLIKKERGKYKLFHPLFKEYLKRN